MKKYLLTTLCCVVSLIATAQDFLPELSPKDRSTIKENVSFKGDKLKTAIFSNYSQVEAGTTIKVAVMFAIPINYRIYSNEPSKTNLPTNIEWALPKGVTVEKVLWQKPSELPDGGKSGYFNSAIVVVHLRIADDYNGADIKILANISYQICDDLHCESGKNIEELKIAIGKAKKTKLFKLI